jgi:hypothetical protein
MSPAEASTACGVKLAHANASPIASRLIILKAFIIHLLSWIRYPKDKKLTIFVSYTKHLKKRSGSIINASIYLL